MSNFQNIVPKQLGQAALTTSVATIYTVPIATANSAVGANSITTQQTTTYVKDINICNTTGAPITVNVHFVPPGGTAGTGNAILYGFSVAANGVERWTGTQLLPPSTSSTSKTTIQASASAAGLTITISGAEAT